MKLSNSQIKALARNIYAEIQSAQKSKLEENKKQFIKEVVGKLKKLNLPFNVVDEKYVIGIAFSEDMIKEIL
ncbi:MAG: hypothetical protein JNK77_01355 [Saprospiraceae bacterium]|nr:hypothetical protein [Saprospiraceae bacterium]